MIGTDAFQETPIVEVCRGITKQHYLVTDVNDITRVVKEAFHVAATGRPGPVLIDIPKDVQEAKIIPDWDPPMDLPGYSQAKPARRGTSTQVAAAIARPSAPDLRGWRSRLRPMPATSFERWSRRRKSRRDDRDGTGCVPNEDPLSLDMVGMHGSVYSNYAMDQADSDPGAGRAFRRSRDREAVGVRQARQDRARRYRCLRAEQEQGRSHSHLQRREDFPRQLNEIVQARDDLRDWHRAVPEWKQNDPFTYDETRRRFFRSTRSPSFRN